MTIKRQSRKRKHEIERAAKTEELRREYELLLSELANTFGIGKKAVVEMGYLEPREDWVKAKLDEILRPAFALTGGTYQEPEFQKNDQQLKFAQFLLKTSPLLFDELRTFLPNFISVFGVASSDENIKEAVNRVERFLDLFWDQSKSPVEGFPLTRSIRTIPENFTWRRYEVPLLFTKLTLDGDSDINENSETYPAVLSAWLEELIADCDYDKELLSHKLENAIATSKKMIPAIIGLFGQHCSDSKTLIRDFVNLKWSLFEWLDRHNIKCDFMLVNAYVLLGQLSRDPSLDINDLRIFGRILPRRLLAEPFEFKADGWWASKESPADFWARIRRECDEKLSSYLEHSRRSLNLDQMTHLTKPKDPDFESVFWLIAWNEGATYTQIGCKFNKSADAVKDRIKLLEQLGLPKRKGLPARKPGVGVTPARMERIRHTFIETSQPANEKQGEILSENR